MMKVLWHVNIPLPDVSNHLGLGEVIYGGWLSGLLKQLKKQADLKLVICFFHTHAIPSFTVDDVSYYAMPLKRTRTHDYLQIINLEKPDIIHVFGTEFPQVLALIQAFNRPQNTIIQLQGLTSYIGKHYSDGIPKKLLHKMTLRDFIKRDSIKVQQNEFKNRSYYEKEMIKASNYVIGRTSFDEMYAKENHPGIHYEKIDEILRDCFYEKSWSLDKVNRHQLLISQTHYPIKGFHLVIPYLESLCQKYPEAKIYVSGKKPYDDTSWKSRFKISSYGLYIKKLIVHHHLLNHIVFTGELTEKKMCDLLLQTHVFLSSSIMENESNALSEAMQLGLPAVVSLVGGISSRLQHGKNGLSYTLDEIEKVTQLIESIFEDDTLALALSKQAKEDACHLFHPEINSQKVIQLYQNIKQTSF